MEKRILFGWLLVTIALALSILMNFFFNLSNNPLTITGLSNPIVSLILYIAGTYFLLAGKRKRK